MPWPSISLKSLIGYMIITQSSMSLHTLCFFTIVEARPASVRHQSKPGLFSFINKLSFGRLITIIMTIFRTVHINKICTLL